MNQTAENLKKAKALIEKGWCQGDFARDDGGRWVRTDSEDACCWCMAGACLAMSPPQEEWESMKGFLLKAIDHSSSGMIAIWNDAPERTKEEVLEAFDKAIQFAETQPV